MANTFRIFVSSTFSDLHAERNALQKFVFPRLRELCLQNGSQFQAIDLCWGVSTEAGRDRQTMKICLEEIKRPNQFEKQLAINNQTRSKESFVERKTCPSHPASRPFIVKYALNQ